MSVLPAVVKTFLFPVARMVT